jgi:hypothetical protein
MQRPGTSPGGYSNRYSYQEKTPQVFTKVVQNPKQFSTDGPFILDRSQSPINRHQFLSKSSNFVGGTGTSVWLSPESQSVDMTHKNDARFQWKPGCGTPRPQTLLLELQDSFTKSEARKQFRQRFPENLPDLRENLVTGRKHEFGNFNAQVLRGTPIVPVQ